jgi:tRNA U34 5-carboxymethylaminomethyl modifying GTPase MnmE/TrmE
MNEDFEKYLRRANRDIQGANNHEELKNYVACILYDNDKKDKEIERLNNKIKTLLKENGNKEKVIIKQNNIVNEMENYINYNLDYWNKEVSQRSSYIRETLTNTLDTLRKLKGKNNDKNKRDF